MTEYKVMAKGKHQKRFRCYGRGTDSYHAERNADSLAKSLWTGSVKIIVTDSNGIKNELIYKK